MSGPFDLLHKALSKLPSVSDPMATMTKLITSTVEALTDPFSQNERSSNVDGPEKSSGKHLCSHKRLSVVT
jgi:hypothetical protein